MAKHVGNPLKAALRKRIKGEILPRITPKSREEQSKTITQKILNSKLFADSQRISIYLNTSTEVDTTELLSQMFNMGKHVFVPTYSGSNMEMVRLRDLADYDALPLTKWKIKQPDADESRENALTNGYGIDLFVIPGVAFTLKGRRLGHGMGYYDKYLERHFVAYPDKKVTLMALAFKEQVVEENELPVDEHDKIIDEVITA